MTIWIDADGCPVIKETMAVADELKIEVIICKNDAVNINVDHATIISLEATKDAVDFYIVTHAKPGDLVVTQDFGLAAMILPKSIHAIRQDGYIYANDNIDLLLSLRHTGAKERRSGKYHSKKKKRTSSDNAVFKEALKTYINSMNLDQ